MMLENLVVFPSSNQLARFRVCRPGLTDTSGVAAWGSDTRGEFRGSALTKHPGGCQGPSKAVKQAQQGSRSVSK